MGTSSSKVSAAGLTADQRLINIRAVTDEYFAYLTTTGGVVLTASFRTQVAQWTVDALTCQGCASLPKEVCLKPTANVYETIQELQHGADDESPIVKHLVHSVVNHQGRLDQDWYQTTLKKLDEDSGLLDSKTYAAGSIEREYLMYCLYAELLCVITTTQWCHMIYVALGETPSKIPPVSKEATAPSFFDWTKALKEGKAAHKDPTIAWMPCLIKADVDPDNAALRQLIESEETRILYLSTMVKMAPFVCITWSPLDFLWIIKLMGAMYAPPHIFFAPHKRLPSDHRCAQTVSRLDLETVALAVSDGYNCHY
jgi:hypothetical protein